MPITPFHFGPGLLVRSLAPEGFSMSMFVLTNVAIDLEPVAWYLLTGDPVHGILHTWLGATLLAIACAYWGRRSCERLLAFWNRQLSPGQAIWLAISPAITKRSALISALAGTWSHVLIDAFMHADVRPFWPIASANNLRGLVSWGALHLACIALGLLGIAQLLMTRARSVATRSIGQSKGNQA